MINCRLGPRWLGFAATLLTAAPVAAEHPDIAPGQDPGGRAVAILSPALDFGQTELQPRLARDGEGVAIAWDFSGTDEETSESDDSVSTGDTGASPQGVATAMIQDLTNRRDIRLVPILINATDPVSLAKALSFVSHTPARLVVLDLHNRSEQHQDILASAARRFPDVLVLAPPNSNPASEPDQATRDLEVPSPPIDTTLIVAGPATAATGPNRLDAYYDADPNPAQAMGAIAQTLSMTVRTLVACHAEGLDKGKSEARSVRAQALLTLAGETLQNGGDGSGPLEIKPCAAAHESVDAGQ